MLRVPALILCASGAAWGQLHEPFPPVFELADVCPVMGGDGSLGFVMEGGVPFGERATPRTAVLGDVNGDGIDDLAVGLSRSVGGSPHVGVTYVVFGRGPDDPIPFGSAFGLFQVNGSNGFRIDGESSYDRAASVAGGGDLNGDGINDIIIGASGAQPDGRRDAGSIYVIYGRDDSVEPFSAVSSLDTLGPSQGFRIDGQVGDRLGGAAFVGDINGDGVDDIAVGRPGEAVGRYGSAGIVYVIFGRRASAGETFPQSFDLADIEPGQGFQLLGYDQYDRAGTFLTTAGDVNGDGVGDMLVGAPGVDRRLAYAPDDQGAVYVIFGKSEAAGQAFADSMELESLDPTDGFEIIGEGARTGMGRSGAAAGDVNNDGLDDIVIGARNDGPRGYSDRPGVAYVIFGRDGVAEPFPEQLDLLDLTRQQGFRMFGVADGDLAGEAVSGGSDIDGDGIDDIVVCASEATAGGRVQAGETYVVYGRDTTAGACFPETMHLGQLDGRAGFKIRGITAGDRAGTPARFGADVNADGAPDIFMGSEVFDPSSPTVVDQTYVVYGRQAPARCRADMDGDGALTLFDFLAFQDAFSTGRDAADLDCDGSLTLFDFLAFQSLFAAGCGG
ncbi:MAG: GC-type dockerin domain-anchored protein [Phycisphaerales bacterium JB060]